MASTIDAGGGIATHPVGIGPVASRDDTPMGSMGVGHGGHDDVCVQRRGFFDAIGL